MKNVIISIAVLLYAAAAMSMQGELSASVMEREAQLLYPNGMSVTIEMV